MEQRGCETSFSRQFLISIPLDSGVKKKKNVLGEKNHLTVILFFSLPSNVIIHSFEIHLYCFGIIYGIVLISNLLDLFIKLSIKGVCTFCVSLNSKMSHCQPCPKWSPRKTDTTSILIWVFSFQERLISKAFLVENQALEKTDGKIMEGFVLIR